MRQPDVGLSGGRGRAAGEGGGAWGSGQGLVARKGVGKKQQLWLLPCLKRDELAPCWRQSQSTLLAPVTERDFCTGDASHAAWHGMLQQLQQLYQSHSAAS
eukprot:14054-Chlamydomonas_euryale.AAC.1